MHGIQLLGEPGGRRRYLREERQTSRCKIEADFTVGGKTVFYKASVVYGQDDNNRDRVYNADEQWNFKQLNKRRSSWLSDDDIALIISGDNQFDIYYARQLRRSLAKEKRIEIKLTRKETEAYRAVYDLRSGIKYYSASQFTNPALCPTSFEIDDDGDLSETYQLRSLRHTRLLYDIYRLFRDDKDRYTAFMSLIGKRGVRLVDGIDWKEFKLSSQVYEVQAGGKVLEKTRKRVMIIPTVKVGSSGLSFSQLSEGTLRTLAMLFYIITEKSEFLLIEEPEVCVHHGLLKSVIEVIKQYSQRKQIIISTHSELVIDQFTPDQVLIVDRSSEAGTQVRSISKIMGKAGLENLKRYLSSVGSLGEYWRHAGFLP